MWITFLLGCGPPPADEPPDGLDALEPIAADLPAPVDGDDTPESASFASGEGEDYDWAHARGFVDVGAEDVAVAFQDPAVGVDRRRIDTWDVEQDTQPDYDVSYTVTNHSTEVIPVDFEVTWIHGESAEGEGAYAARWSKTGGTELISLIEGSAQFLPAGDATTEVQIEYHLVTPDSGPEDARQYLSDVFDTLVAASHGEPLPDWGTE